MKPTVTIEELASALDKPVEEFREVLSSLIDLGFPSPVESSDDEFEVRQVLDWVLEHQTLAVNILTLVSEKLTASS